MRLIGRTPNVTSDLAEEPVNLLLISAEAAGDDGFGTWTSAELRQAFISSKPGQNTNCGWPSNFPSFQHGRRRIRLEENSKGETSVQTHMDRVGDNASSRTGFFRSSAKLEFRIQRTPETRKCRLGRSGRSRHQGGARTSANGQYPGDGRIPLQEPDETPGRRLAKGPRIGGQQTV